MANDINITNNTSTNIWEAKYTVDAAGTKEKTLATAGTFLDRNIKMQVTTPSGDATISGGDLTVTSNYSVTPTVGISLDSQTTSGISITDTAQTSGYYIKLTGSTTKTTGVTTVRRNIVTLTKTAGYINSGSSNLASATTSPSVTVNAGSKTRYLVLPSAIFSTSGNIIYTSSGGWVPTGSTATPIGTIGNGTLSASLNKNTSGSASITATGFDPISTGSYYVTLTTTAGSVTPQATVATPGYVTSAQDKVGTAVSVGVTGNNSHIYIPTNSITGSVTSLTAPQITITDSVSTSIATTSIATDYFITINNTVTNGSVKGKATAGATTGIVAANASHTSNATTIVPDVTGGNTTIYIPEATLTVQGINASATTTVAPGTVSIAANTASVSGKTRIAITPATSTANISTYYIAVRATAAANTTGTTSNISGTTTASIGTGGYAPTGKVTTASITGTAKAVTSSKNSSIYYLPVPTATFNTSGATIYCTTAGWVPTGSASSGIGTIANGTLAVTGGGLTASTGSASLASSGYYNGSSYDSSDTITLSTTETSGYYKLVASGSGKVTRAAINKQITDAGYFPADTAAIQQIAVSTGTSNVGTANYYIKKSTLSATSVNSSSTAQTITVSSGYHPNNRTITVNAMATGTVTPGFNNANITTYFNTTSTTTGSISITPKYSNTAGYIAAHSNTTGTTTYYNIKTTSVTQGTTTVSGSTATRGSATWGTGWLSSGSIAPATFANTATSGITYVNISNTPDAPILDAEGNLYINKGYVDNLQISLARLIPDDANVASSATMLQGTTAYDKNGKLWTGTIATFTPNAKYYATTSDQTLSINGKYVSGGNIVISRLTSSNYTAANIRKGATISINNGSSNVYSVAGTFTSAGTQTTGTVATADNIVQGYTAWADGAEINGNIIPRTSADLHTSGDTITATSGYYAEDVSLAIGAGAYTATASRVTSGTITPSVSITSASTYGFTTAKPTAGTYLTVDPGASVATKWKARATAAITTSGYLTIGSKTHDYEGTPTINAGTNFYVPVVTPAFSGGAYTINSNTNTVTTAPVVTISGSGTLLTSGSNYGVTASKPSGTDGTNYLTIDGTGSVTTTGTVTSQWQVTKAANTYSAAYKGVVNLASGSTAVASTTTSSSSAVSVTPTITDNFTPRYIPIVTPQVTAGSYTTNTNKNTVTNPQVTIAASGSFITNSATYGLTTTAISGTDGTAYLTIDAVPTSTTGQAVSEWKATKAASTYSTSYQGLVNLTSGAQVVPPAIVSGTTATTITTTVTDNFPKYYIPIVSAPTFNGGTPTINLSSNAVTSSNITTATTGTYYITVTATGTATRGAVTYSNTSGVIAAHNGASALSASTSTASSTATTIYIPTASITVSSSALTVGSAGMTAAGFTAASSSTYYVSLTTTAGSLTPKATVTSGYTTGRTINGNAINIGVSVTNQNGKLYIPTASISTITTTAYTAPSVEIETATNMETVTSSDYYIAINGTPSNGSIKAYAKTSNTTGIIAANTAATQTTGTTITPEVSGEATIYIPKATAALTKTSGTITANAAMTGTNATLSDTNNGIKIVATGGGSASLTATAVANQAGYIHTDADMGSATFSIANTTTTTTKYLSGVKLEAPASGTRSFTITVPNGSTTDFIDFVFTVDSSGNVTVNGN